MGSEQWAAGASNYPSLGCLTFCDHQVVTKLSATKDRYLDVNYHIKKIFESLELLPEATIRKFRIVQQEGGRQVTRSVDHYNLQDKLFLSDYDRFILQLQEAKTKDSP